MKIGISVLGTNPRLWLDIAIAADELGYESIWVSDHLVLPVDRGDFYPGSENPDSPNTTITQTGPSGDTFPFFDAPTILSAMAVRTSYLRLGTYVYLLGLRHPLITARAFQTVDLLSDGRLELGVGSGWLQSEWRAAGMNWTTRGKALDEAIDVCRQLWSERIVEHDGEIWRFDPVWFEPKPAQHGGPPIHVGGESDAAMARAVRRGDGWIALEHTPETIGPKVRKLKALAIDAGRPANELTITVLGGINSPDDIRTWESTGIDRLLVTPWKRSRQAIEGMTRLAQNLGLGDQKPARDITQAADRCNLGVSRSTPRHRMRLC